MRSRGWHRPLLGTVAMTALLGGLLVVLLPDRSAPAVSPPMAPASIHVVEQHPSGRRTENDPERSLGEERLGRRSAGPIEDPVTVAGAWTLRGRCVAPDATPLAGVRVGWSEVAAEDAGKAAPIAGQELTDGNGNFRLGGVPLERDLRLYLRAEGFLPISMAIEGGSDTRDHDLGTIVVPRGVHVSGVAVERSGAPLTEVTIRLERLTDYEAGEDPRPEQSEHATTDAFGEFDLGLCVPGTYAVDCAEHVVLEGRLVFVAPTSDRFHVHVVAEPVSNDLLLTGVVRSTLGELVAGAKVYATDGRSGHFRATADGQGQFRLVSDRARTESLALSATAEGYDLAVFPGRHSWGEQEVELTLRRAVGLALRVLDPDGRPVPSYTVRLYRLGAHPLVPLRREPFVFSPRLDPDGITRIPDLKGGAHRLRVEPEGGADLARSPLLAHVVQVDVRNEGGEEELTITLPRRTQRLVRIVTQAGAPLPGCRLELFETQPEDHDGGVFDDVPFGWDFRMPRADLLLVAGDTDERGQLLVHGPSRTPLILQVRGPGCTPQNIELPALEGEGVLEIAVQAPTSVWVSVDTPPILTDICRALSRSPIVRFFPEGTDLRREGVKLVLDPHSFAEGEDGSLERIAFLHPGTWRPVLDLLRERVVLDPITLAQGESHALTLDLTPFAPGILEGSVLWGTSALSLVDIELQQLVTVLGGQRAYWQPRPVRCDAAGRFRAECLPGTYRVLVPRPGSNVQGAVASPGSIELAPSEVRSLEFRLELGSLRLRFRDGRGLPVAGVGTIELRRASDSSWVSALGPSDEEGWIHAPRCEVGTFRLYTYPRALAEHRARVDFAVEMGLAALDQKRIDLGTITVPANDAAELEITLPAVYFE